MSGIGSGPIFSLPALYLYSAMVVDCDFADLLRDELREALRVEVRRELHAGVDLELRVERARADEVEALHLEEADVRADVPLRREVHDAGVHLGEGVEADLLTRIELDLAGPVEDLLAGEVDDLDRLAAAHDADVAGAVRHRAVHRERGRLDLGGELQRLDGLVERRRLRGHDDVAAVLRHADDLAEEAARVAGAALGAIADEDVAGALRAERAPRGGREDELVRVDLRLLGEVAFDDRGALAELAESKARRRGMGRRSTPRRGRRCRRGRGRRASSGERVADHRLFPSSHELRGSLVRRHPRVEPELLHRDEARDEHEQQHQRVLDEGRASRPAQAGRGPRGVEGLVRRRGRMAYCVLHVLCHQHWLEIIEVWIPRPMGWSTEADPDGIHARQPGRKLVSQK